VAGSPETEVSAQRTSEILDEAIMASSSSVRDSLPEQHRTHFETLRQEIIDFAQAHGIPKDALAKPQDLQEAAKKLSTPDLERLANLLERFEHLIVKKEPWKNTEANEYAEKFYHLKEQYNSQVALLEQVGILDRGAIRGIDGKEYPIPTLEQITIRLFERREELFTKHDQGFTKLLLVPFGMSLDFFIPIFEKFLLSYRRSHLEFDLDIEEPFLIRAEYNAADIGDSPKLVYEPQSFTKTGHGGKTKTQILEDQSVNPSSFPGWMIHLFQPSDPSDSHSPGFVSISKREEEKVYGNEIPRKDFEVGKTPDMYRSILKEAQNNEDSPYHGETGLTLEDWILAFITHLEETRRPLDSWSAHEESIPYLIGSFFPSIVSRVPYVAWSCIKRKVDIDSVSWANRSPFLGIRTSVII